MGAGAEAGTAERSNIRELRICAKRRKDVEPSLAPVPNMNFSRVQSCMNRSPGALGGSESYDLVGVILKIALVVKGIWLAKGEFVNRAGAPAAVI
jgi:hypothetical protein